MEYTSAAKLLKGYGIRSIESAYVRDAESAIKFSKGGKIALKGISSRALHKSKAGLVKLNLSSKEIEPAFKEIEKRSKKFSPYRILAQRMAEPGIEIIIGGRVDPQFGKMILLGLGGIYVETFKDFSLRACPITAYDARKMVSELRSRRIITYGGRGSAQLESLLLKASKLIAQNKIGELDLNPVIVREKGYDVVDIRILW
ncbi:MAG: acetate--CoA ligase family protein [Candidatus Micrarchaeota archaeon]|nr:acetate--CoA ligase family protein [Candidatus Micrarchaeota archaeon]MDE1847468.1 acetate--CoA ligase family protein [Candidatus Micrarchaeota archaeon]MDE1864037.1 acetate--CoA ligase family protein [Candidatus Micrarchaeota archaeon]